jgi:hypothetical protein
LNRDGRKIIPIFIGMNLYQIRLALFLLFCFAVGELSAQTPKQIEVDLLKSFKKINYYDDKERTDTTGNIKFLDSLENANTVFAKKLKDYTIRYPSTISQNFNLLRKEQLDIFTSSDGLFRIYSWETWLCGTMRDFANIFQYKAGNQVKSLYLHSPDLSDKYPYIPFYSNLYTFKVSPKTYYLGIYGCIYSTKDVGNGIKIFDIENGKLNDDVKILKTSSGLHSQIYYDFDFFSIVDIPYEKRPTITFDVATQTIHVPLVAEKGRVTKKYIIYKFTGKYFERAKS